MRGKGLLIGMLMVAVASFSFTAMADYEFEAYFSDSQGNKITQLDEGRTFYVAVRDEFKGACGLDSFEADILIFDYNTGAYIKKDGVRFIETGFERGVYVWEKGVPLGGRMTYETVTFEYPRQLADRTLTEEWAPGYFHTLGHEIWSGGEWIYDYDEGARVHENDARDSLLRQVLDNELFSETSQLEPYDHLFGRVENHDTLVVLVRDKVDGWMGAGQLKVSRTQSSISTSITEVFYGCSDIIVEIDDPDESLSRDRADIVPFFVIVNPGAWNPQTGSAYADQTPSQELFGGAYAPTTFPDLFRTGGIVWDGSDFDLADAPIRWYDIYYPRYMLYPWDAEEAAGQDRNVPWHWNFSPPASINDTWDWDQAQEADPQAIGVYDFNAGAIEEPATWGDDESIQYAGRPHGLARATFYARETGSDTGVFRKNFGSLDQLQAHLGFDRFPAGTTIAFYYVDPNDFSDVSVTTIHVRSPFTRSKVEFTDYRGTPLGDYIRLGEDSLHFRVEDGKMNLDDCLQEHILVNVFGIHGLDTEYWKLDEIAGPAGVFMYSGAMRLEPVFDAVGGYQLDIDDGRLQAYNADALVVRYNAVLHRQEHMDELHRGDWAVDDYSVVWGDSNDHFPPEITIDDDEPYYFWDVAFDTIKVTDFHVFDGVDTHIRMLDGRRREVPTYRPSDEVYIEVKDLDQNEDSRVAERISSRWDRPTDLSDSFRDSAPIWGLKERDAAGDQEHYNVLGDFLGGEFDWEANDDNGFVRPAKVFLFNPRNGRVVPVDLMETGPDTGVFTSTTGLVVNDHLGGREGDTIVAFYQDPSNHSDIAIKTIRVRGAVVDVDDPQVSFDQNSYIVGDEATITVTEPAYVGASSIANDEVLVVRDADGAVVESWDEIPAENDDQFAVSFTIPEGFAFGTWTVDYVDPADADRTADDTAQVTAAVLDDVTGIEIDPEFLVDEVTFSLIAEPVGAVADRFTIMVYDLTGRKVAEFSDQGVDQLTWDGENLRSTAFIYVAVVESAGNTWTFRGPVYIRR